MPLDNYQVLISAILANMNNNRNDTISGGENAWLRKLNDVGLGKIGTMYCPTCSEYCGMKVTPLFFHGTIGQTLLKHQHAPHEPMPDQNSVPSLFRYECVNCPTLFWVLLYYGNSAPRLAIFPSKSGGISTKLTPPDVSYYVDQAYKAQMVSAYSAAMGMYRAALEKLLQEHGFTGKLPAMFAQLESNKKSGNAPKWAHRLNIEALKLTKEIADSQMHANEIEQLKALSPHFMNQVQANFIYLLHVVYEEEPRQQATKSRLNEVLKKAKGKQQ